MNRRRQREELFDPATIACLERIGVGDGWHCLEVGAGEGSIAEWLVARAGTGRVTTTDVAPDYLEAARARLGGLATVLEHDLEADPLPAGAFDLVHLRFVLEHVADKEAALAKLTAALRPGGWLVVEYTDFTACRSGGGGYAEAMAAFADALPRVGADDSWGARLAGVAHGLDLDVAEAFGHQRWFPGGSAEAMYWTSLWFDLRRRVKDVSTADDRIARGIADIADPGRWFPGPAIVTVVARRP